MAAFGLTVLCVACGNSAATSKPAAGHGGSSGSRAAIDGGLHAVNGNAGGSSGSADVGSGRSGSSDGGTAGGSGASASGGSSNVGSGGVGGPGVGGASGIGASGGKGGGRGGASGSAGAGPVTGGTDPTMLPTAKGTCPTMSQLDGTDVSFAGQPYTVWSGDPANGPGPLLIYWHADGGDSMEPTSTIQLPQIQRITAAGGVVVAQVSSTQSGQSTSPGSWYSGDFDIADEVVACAIEQQQIDKRRIWTAGYYFGGVQSVAMWYARSGYVAGAISYSGGDFFPGTLQDPSHLPVGLASHGALGKDKVGDLIDNVSAIHQWETHNPTAFIIDCDDGGGPGDKAARTMMAPQAIQMLWDHPFGITPEPYASGLPADWPSTCVPPPVPANH